MYQWCEVIRKASRITDISTLTHRLYPRAKGGEKLWWWRHREKTGPVSHGYREGELPAWRKIWSISSKILAISSQGDSAGVLWTWLDFCMAQKVAWLIDGFD